MTDTAQCGRCGAPVEVGALFCARCGVDVTAPGGEDPTVLSTGGSAAPAGRARSTMRQMLREATLGEYEILDELGRGGMATVFRAHDISLDRKVAIKVMAPHLVEGEGMAERFKLEARTAAQLSHPHIIPIYAVKESASTLFFVMKYVEGRPLDDIIAKTGPLPIPMVKDVLIKVGSALGYAHRRGVVHRDVKPGNIMIDEEGTPIVTDFGIAKVTQSTRLTVTGTTIGTPSYMSPEQCEAKEVRGASDQYSLGIVAFQMLTGKLPFEGDSAVTVMYKHCHDELPPLSDFRPDCPPEILATVERMVAKAPADRWPSMEAAVQKLGTATTSQTYLDPIREQLVKAAQEGDLELLAQLSTPGGPISPVGGTDPSGRAGVSAAPRGRRRAFGVAATVVVLGAAGALAVLQPWAGAETASLEGDAGSTGVLQGGDDPATGGAEGGPGDAGADPEGGAPTGGDAGGATPVGGRGSPDDAASAGGADDEEPARTGDATRPPTTTEAARTVVGEVRIGGLPGTIEVGETVDLTATAVEQGGRVIAPATVESCRVHGWSRCGFQWSSSDESVARVSGGGLLTALSPGRASITVMVDGVAGGGSLTVSEASVASVVVEPESLRIGVGDRATVTARARDRSGQPLTGRVASWLTSDPGIAEVSADGEVMGRGPGQARITASVGGEGGSVTVTVDVDAETAARGLVAAYAIALEDGDLGAARRLFTRIPRNVEEAFQGLAQLQNLDVQLSLDALEPAGDTARGTVSGSYAFVDRAVGRTTLRVAGPVTFERGADGIWRLATVDIQGR